MQSEIRIEKDKKNIIRLNRDLHPIAELNKKDEYRVFYGRIFSEIIQEKKANYQNSLFPNLQGAYF